MIKEEGYSPLKTFAICLGITLMILAVSIPILLGNILSVNEEKSDYSLCIEKCPSDFGGDFVGLECPKMCSVLNCSEFLK